MPKERKAAPPPEFHDRRHLVPPTDYAHGWRIAKIVYQGLKDALRWGRAAGLSIEIIIRVWRPSRSDSQRNTLWMWHSQVASELSIRTGRRWEKEDVHDLIFLARWMPTKELIDVETGEVLLRPIRTSDKAPAGDPRSMRLIISEAMTQYLVWCYDQGIEITVPQDKTW